MPQPPDDGLFADLNTNDLAAAVRRPAPTSYLSEKPTSDEDVEVNKLLGLDEPELGPSDPLFEGYDEMDF